MVCGAGVFGGVGFARILAVWIYVDLLITCFGVLVLFSIWLFLVRFLVCCGGGWLHGVVGGCVYG